MAMGDGTHKLPVKAEIRRAIGKEVGDTVAILLEARIDKRFAKWGITLKKTRLVRA